MLQQEQMFAGDPQLRINPKHIPLIEKELGDSLTAHGWKVVADNSIHVGGCRVVTNDGDLDSTIATRWHELCRLAAPGGVVMTARLGRWLENSLMQNLV
ncbi:flagellar assembly protein H [Proteus mirabilis]|uniref:Flagellar assembly protein FliH n=1 Tax=Proteus mirabilis TaxID=584 RepID=A0A379GGE7_PROMI|nr:flagellar assembly protein H [Proteus mirabilis]